MAKSTDMAYDPTVPIERQLAEALGALARAPTPEGKNKADAFLRYFSDSVESWSILQRILSEHQHPHNVHMYAAITLRRKISMDLQQLDQSGINGLLRFLLTYLSQSHPRPFVDQICSGLATLAALHTSWENPVQDVVNMLATDQKNLLVTLQFLQNLPWEFSRFSQRYDYGCDGDDDDGFDGDGAGNNSDPRFKQVITDKSPVVLVLCASGFSQLDMLPEREAQTVLGELFQTLSVWCETRSITFAQVLQSQVVGRAFHAMSRNVAFDKAADLLIEIIGMSRKHGEGWEIKNEILPGLLQLRSQIAAVDEYDDPETANWVGRLYAMAVDCYLPRILTEPNEFGGLLEALLACSNLAECETLRITEPSWVSLAYELSRDKYAPGPGRDRHPIFVSAFEGLVDTVMKCTKFEEDYQSLSAKDMEEFKEYRYDMGSLLKEALQVLPHSLIMRKALSLLQKSLQTNSWPDAEAALFTIRQIGRLLDEEGQALLPEVMLAFQSLMDHPRVQQSAVLVISVCTEWTRKNPNFAAYQMEFISKSFASPDVVSAAARSFRYLCLDCGDFLLDYVDRLYPFYLNALNNLAQDDVSDICMGIAHIVSRSPPDQVLIQLQRFTHPLLERIHRHINGGGDLRAQPVELDIDNQLRCLDTFTYQVSHAFSPQHTCLPQVSTLLDSICPLLETTQTSLSYSERVHGVICRIFRGYFHAVGGALAKDRLFEPVVGNVEKMYRNTGYACYINLAARMAEILFRGKKSGSGAREKRGSGAKSGGIGRKQEVGECSQSEPGPREVSLLVALCRALVGETMRKAQLSGGKQPQGQSRSQQDPDVVVDLFKLLAKMQDLMPETFASDITFTDHVFEFSVHTLLTTFEPDALAAVLRFLREFRYQHPADEGGKKGESAAGTSGSEGRTGARAVRVLGAIFKCLALETITGESYAACVDILVLLRRVSPDSSPRWLFSACQSSLVQPGIASDAEVQALVADYVAQGGNDKRGLKRSVIKFVTTAIRRVRGEARRKENVVSSGGTG